MMNEPLLYSKINSCLFASYFRACFLFFFLPHQGEAILMIMTGNKIEKSVADHLLTADVDPLRSHLHIAVGEFAGLL